MTLYRALAALVWWGTIFCLLTLGLAAALVAVVLTAAYGGLHRHRTARGQLRILAANARAAIALVLAQRREP